VIATRWAGNLGKKSKKLIMIMVRILRALLLLTNQVRKHRFQPGPKQGFFLLSYRIWTAGAT
jgi:hypothetical protein